MKKQVAITDFLSLIGLAFLVMLFGCVKELSIEGVYSETEYKGRIVTNEGIPVSGVSVFLRSAAGVKINQQITDEDGRFVVSATLDELDGKALYFDGGGSHIL